MRQLLCTCIPHVQNLPEKEGEKNMAPEEARLKNMAPQACCMIGVSFHGFTRRLSKGH